MNTNQSSIADSVESILNDMETCVSEQESIIVEERQALRKFDANALTELITRRVRCQSILSELESQCNMLCEKAGFTNSSNQRMAYIIENFVSAKADDLQSKRIELVRRMQSLEHEHVENHIRLRAAWNVTTNILQQVGVIETPSTYANLARTQAAR